MISYDLIMTIMMVVIRIVMVMIMMMTMTYPLGPTGGPWVHGYPRASLGSLWRPGAPMAPTLGSQWVRPWDLHWAPLRLLVIRPGPVEK